MIRVVIFSFDRAMQLDLLLRSIDRFDRQRLFSVCVLYAYSSGEYQAAYDRLKNKYPNIYWLPEQRYDKPQTNYGFDFRYWHNFYWWLKSPVFRNNPSNFKSCLMKLLANTKQAYTLFLTDDSLFYRPIAIHEMCLDKIRQQPEKYSFSLRHGTHLTGGIYREESNVIYWNVYENDATTDWGYPFSVDGHVYDSRILYRIIRKILLNNPNTMEGNTACYVNEKKLFPALMASKQSCLIGFELNRVQTLVDNHHWGISQEKLNQYYLDGYTLEIGFDQSNIKYFRPEFQALFVEKENKKTEIWIK